MYGFDDPDIIEEFVHIKDWLLTSPSIASSISTFDVVDAIQIQLAAKNVVVEDVDLLDAVMQILNEVNQVEN